MDIIFLNTFEHVSVQPTTSSAAENDSPPALYEQSLDRLACAMGGKVILPPSFQVTDILVTTGSSN